jgi:aconitate hydratase
MGSNLTEKILASHGVCGRPAAGTEIEIGIDHTLTQDATGTMAALQFESLGLDRVRNELAVSYVDHNTIQIGPENADDQAYLQSAAARFGMVFSKPGNGICHQIHLERFGAPGRTLLGSDSHTPTAGGLGMLAMGAGGLDVAVAMGGGPFPCAMPRVVKIELTGRLRPWVSAKDVILKVLEIFSTRGNANSVFEYGGPALRRLDVPERATIANMGAECGVTASLFPSDEVTRAFLEAQGRGAAWCELKPDRDARYDREITIDLAGLEPLAAAPHSPGNVVTVASLAGMPVQQVLIGSCTNASYRDLRKVAEILRGRTVAAGVQAGLAPGSRQVFRMLAAEGWLTVLADAGVRILESACGFCIGNSMSPPSRGVSLRTSNRNFEGRSGTPSGQVYLVGPETAALAALAGRVAPPSEFAGLTCPRPRRPHRYPVDDSMLVFPDPARIGRAPLVKGPGIGAAPRNEPLPAALEGVATIKVGDNITTDHIMPAGPRLKYRSNIERYSAFVFEGVDAEFAARARANRDTGVHNFIVAGESYGQGSSREHAAMCPMYLGVKAVIACSLERIHLANLVNFGVVPLLFACPADGARIAAGDRLRMPRAREALQGTCAPTLENLTRNETIALRLALTERQRRILLRGGLLNDIIPERDSA